MFNSEPKIMLLYWTKLHKLNTMYHTFVKNILLSHAVRDILPQGSMAHTSYRQAVHCRPHWWSSVKVAQRGKESCFMFVSTHVKLVCRNPTETPALCVNLHAWLFHRLWHEVTKGQGQSRFVVMSCFFKIAQDSGEVEWGWTDSWLCLCLFERNFNQDGVKWVGKHTNSGFSLEKWWTCKGDCSLSAWCVCAEMGNVCLVHVSCSWPLITQSILIQSASFSHDCHTLAAAMVT